MDNVLKTTLEPLVEFNNLVAQTTESLTSAHFKNIEVFTKLGLDNFNKGINIRTYDEAVSFIEQQSVLFNSILINESKTYTDITNSAFDKTQQFYVKGVKQFCEAGYAKDKVTENKGSSSVVKEPAKKATVKPVTKKATAKPATTKKNAIKKAPAQKPKPKTQNTSKTTPIVKPEEAKTAKAKTSPQPSPAAQKTVTQSATSKVASIKTAKTAANKSNFKK